MSILTLSQRQKVKYYDGEILSADSPSPSFLSASRHVRTCHIIKRALSLLPLNMAGRRKLGKEELCPNKEEEAD